MIKGKVSKPADYRLYVYGAYFSQVARNGIATSVVTRPHFRLAMQYMFTRPRLLSGHWLFPPVISIHFFLPYHFRGCPVAEWLEKRFCMHAQYNFKVPISHSFLCRSQMTDTWWPQAYHLTRQRDEFHISFFILLSFCHILCRQYLNNDITEWHEIFSQHVS